MTICERDPDRWRDPDPADADAREACTYCWRHRQCAADALRFDVAWGIWAGLLVPPKPSGNSYAAMKTARDAVLAELAVIAQSA